ncbi:signal peptide peptidase SppA [Croceivirga sp. JEA036]|uniref:signal peptide peptidase SppA n=1 Tax=Croceivirga sp. JEA036 TaxID=2721162 RepID=UPI00143B06C8|nr:signal peptide peptidase SppA [Croceivirga sp. JEA036]NJB36184.1 signal peptide peptidase SppA [Croceivirga sp. JEA036]
MKFLRNLLAAIIGCLIAFGILFFMFFLLTALLGSAGDEVVVKENSVLQISFTEPIYDYQGGNADDPFAALFEQGQGLDKILHAISVAKNDDKIKGISLTQGFLMSGLAQTQEIRNALQDFKTEGKFVYAYADYYGQQDYYLASVADKVFVNPQGLMDFKGLASEVLYYKKLQEKTGLKMEVIRHGKYKSAVEPFLADEMSAENRTQLKELLTSVWDAMLVDIADSRKLSVSELNTIADTLGGRTAKMAVANGLLDGVLYLDEYENTIKETLGIAKDKKVNYVELGDYIKSANNKNKPKGSNKIAVIYAQGEIMYGDGSKDIIGQGNMQEALKKVREDDAIKAVVMRVNSPGGSSLVSDMIWREVELTKAKKPVVVSFGNVAASGGYYIAAGANKIFAEPTTITGSIGVFGTIPNIHEFANEIGINAEQVGTNANSVDYSVFEPMTEQFRNQVLESIEETYDTFLDRVATGRGMSKDEVNDIAQGRVWSGIDAQKIGLVDELGNLEDAIAAAAELAELKEFGIKKYPKFKSEFEQMMEGLSGAKVKLGEQIIKEELGADNYMRLKEIKAFTEKRGIQARLPYDLNIK